MTPQRMTVPPGGQRRGREQAWEATRAVWVTLGIALGLSVGLLWLLGAVASPAAVGLPALRLAAATAWGLVVVAALRLLRRRRR
jgi:hypothetical protein